MLCCNRVAVSLALPPWAREHSRGFHIFDRGVGCAKTKQLVAPLAVARGGVVQVKDDSCLLPRPIVLPGHRAGKCYKDHGDLSVVAVFDHIAIRAFSFAFHHMEAGGDSDNQILRFCVCVSRGPYM